MEESVTTAERVSGLFRTSRLLLDGATGTELERRGVDCPAPLWSAAALLNAQDTLVAIHQDHVTAGADILVANTFRTNPRTLERAGLRERGAELNRLAVDLARRAAAGQPRAVLVAASVGPVEDCYTPALVPDESELQREHGQMADWLAAAGPDLLWIETIGTVREVRAAAASAAERGLPFVVSFVLREMKDAVPAGGRNARSTDMPTLLGGELLEEAVAAVTPFGPLAIGLNCIPPRGLREALPRLRAMTDLPLAAYAHINNVSPTPGWSYSEAVGPAEYAAYAAGWRAAGAAIIGGCCGTTPAHIAALRGIARALE